MTAEDYKMIKWEHVLLDVCFKLGQLTNMNAIEEYVGALIGK